MSKQIVLTKARTRWVHESGPAAGQTCPVADGFEETGPGTGVCRDHGRRIERAIDPGTLVADVQIAQDAMYGESNDDEISYLRSALRQAVELLGLEMPEGHDPDFPDD